MVIKTKEITISRGRKYSQNYNSANYQVSVTVEATAAKDTLEDMRKEAMEVLMKLETEELGHCGDVAGVMEIENQMMQDKNLKSVKKAVDFEKVIRKSSPGFKSFTPENNDKANKTAAKLLQEMPDDEDEEIDNEAEDGRRQYKSTGTTCKDCGALITWEGWTKGTFPLHIDKEGHLVNDGNCPMYDGGK